MARGIRLKPVKPVLENGEIVIKRNYKGEFYYKDEALRKIMQLKAENDILRKSLRKKSEELENLKQKGLNHARSNNSFQDHYNIFI